MVVATEGNMSARLGGGFFLVSPAGARKGDLQPEDLLLVDESGQTAEDVEAEATSEWPMHWEIYARRPDVMAVCHAHPPYATAFAVARKSLKSDLMPESVMQFGEIPVASYSTPGTDELAASLRDLIVDHDALLLANHGAVTVGRNPLEAVHRMELVERLAMITMLTEALGGGVPLSALEIARILTPTWL